MSSVVSLKRDALVSGEVPCRCAGLEHFGGFLAKADRGGQSCENVLRRADAAVADVSCHWDDVVGCVPLVARVRHQPGRDAVRCVFVLVVVAFDEVLGRGEAGVLAQ